MTEEQLPILAEAGDPGVKRQGGYVYDEWHPKLSGRQGMRVYRQMYDNSGVLGGATRAIQFLMNQAEWLIESKQTNPDPQQTYWADRVRAALFEDMETAWSSVLMSITTLIPFGWSCIWQSWKICRGDYGSELFDSQFDDGLISFRDMEPRGQQTLERWLYDDDDKKVIGWYQISAPSYRGADLYADRYMHFRMDPNKGNPEGRSMYRNSYRDWFYANRLEEIRAVGEERNLAGYPVINVPAPIMSPNANAENRAIRSLMEQKIGLIRRDQLEGVLFPAEKNPDGSETGYKFSLMSAGARDRGSITQAINDHRANAMIGMLSQFFLLGQQKTGSYSLSSDQTELFAVAIGAIMDMICEVVNKQGIERMMRLNDVPREMWPECKHGDIEEEKASELIAAFTQGVQGGFIVPTDADDAHAREILAWPQRDADAVPLPVPSAQPGLGGFGMVENQEPEPELPEIPEPEADDKDDGAPTPALTVDEAADQLNLSRGQVMAAIRSGRLPGRRIGSGGNYRIMPDHLEAFMRNAT